MFQKESVAKGIRVLSIPPVMITALILILAYYKEGVFRNHSEMVITILLLGFVPVLAYGLQKILPGFKEQGREGQRKLAFLFNLISDSVAFLWALLIQAGKDLLLIYSTYFLSVVILTICNKGFHYRASGHACSFTGPFVLLVYFLGWKVVLPCLVIAGLIVWSSLYLKRHTIKELVGGIVVCLLSFALSLVMIYCRIL